MTLSGSPFHTFSNTPLTTASKESYLRYNNILSAQNSHVLLRLRTFLCKEIDEAIDVSRLMKSYVTELKLMVTAVYISARG